MLETYRQRFGEHIPLIRRQDIKGFIRRRPIWLVRPLGIHAVRKQVEIMELETRRFYERAGAAVSDASVRKLLGDLADAERKHSAMAESLEKKYLTPDAKTEEEISRRRLFVLQIVQPGLAGLMDGSVSILDPCSRLRLRPEIAGTLSWCGYPWLRGIVYGLMTTAAGMGHTLPFLIPDFRIAMTAAIAVVAVGLGVISFIRHRYMDTPLFSSAIQVMVGGALVFLAGILIGGS